VWRDSPVTLQEINDHTDALSSATTIGNYIVESVDVLGDMEKRIVLRDDLVLLERPLQKKFFYPDADGNAANRAWPTSIGACFNIPLQLYDEAELIYALDSEGAQGIGAVRDRGDPLDIAASPADYTLLNGGQSIQLRYAPVGAVTCDLSVTGSSYDPPDPTPDEIDNDGYPFTGTVGQNPDGWARATDGTTAALPYVDVTGRLHFPQEYVVQSYVEHYTGQFVSGQTYRIQFEVDQIQGYVGGTLLNAKVGVSYLPSTFGSILEATTGSGTGIYERLWTCPPGGPTGIYIYYQGNNATGGAATETIIKNVRVRLLPSITVEDPADDELIEPITLTDFCRQVIEVRGGLPASYWESNDTEVIDAITGYRGIGYHSSDQVAIRLPLEEALQSYTACLWKDSNGKLRVTRLTAPEDYPSEYVTHELRESDMYTDLVPAWDPAPGLSRALGVRRNWRVMTDSEIVTDDEEPSLTLALRRRLGRDFRFVARSGRPLAPGYADAADSAELVPTLLNDYDDGLAEIDRICEIYSVDRMTYTTSVASEDCPELGSIVRVYYSRYGLQDGEQMLVKSITEDRVNREVKQIVLWGRSRIS
jgi:hypothetical protein